MTDTDTNTPRISSDEIDRLERALTDADSQVPALIAEARSAATLRAEVAAIREVLQEVAETAACSWINLRGLASQEDLDETVSEDFGHIVVSQKEIIGLLTGEDKPVITTIWVEEADRLRRANIALETELASLRAGNGAV